MGSRTPHQRTSLRDTSGFTIVESLIALLLLSLGIMALASSGLQVKTLLDRSARAQAVAHFATRRLELLRPLACIPARRTSGTETLSRGSAHLAANSWSFEASGSAIVIRVITSHVERAGRQHTDTVQTAVACGQ